MNAWDRFWFSRADVLPLSIARIGIGLIWLAILTVTAPNWHRFYGFDGVMSLGAEDLNAMRTLGSSSIIGWTDGVLPISFWWWVGIVLSVSLALGLQTRIATVGLFLFTSSLIQRNTYVVNGEELVTRMLLFYGCFSPWGSRLSLDSWLRNRNVAASIQKTHPFVWSWRMMQINFLLIYAISLPNKFAQDIDWLTGDALHWTIASDMWWSRGWLSELTLGYNGIFRKAMTWGTVLVEGLFPILVCFQRTRIPITLIIMGLHLSIAFCIPGVTLFTLSMVVGAAMLLPASFYTALTSGISAISRCMAAILCPTKSTFGMSICSRVAPDVLTCRSPEPSPSNQCRNRSS